MALAYLGILNIGLTVLAVLFQVLLYRAHKSKKDRNIIFMINVFLGIILSVIAYSALPSNFIGEKVIAISLGLVAVLAIGVRVKTEKPSIIGKLMLTISIIGGIVELYI